MIVCKNRDEQVFLKKAANDHLLTNKNNDYYYFMTLGKHNSDIDAPYKPLTRKQVKALWEDIVASVRDGSGGYCEPYGVSADVPQTPRTAEEIQRVYQEWLRLIF